MPSLPPINIGLVGLGRAGRFRLERIGLRDELRILASHDSDEAVRSACRGDAIPCHDQLDRLLTDSRIEAIWIATPPETHLELASAALRAGKHVVVEPPLTLCVEAGQSLLALAREYGKSLIVAHTRRGDDEFIQAMQTVQSGSLGQLLSLRMTCWQYNPPQLRQHRRGETSWRDSLDTGGGVLWELGTHFIDQLLQLTSDTPQTVYACAPGASRDLTENVIAIITFARGAIATLDISRASPIPRNSGWEINGSAGSYAGNVLFTATPEGEVEDIPDAAGSSEPDQFYQTVAQHLRGAAPNPAPAEQSLEVVRLIEAIRRSAETGALVHL